MNNGIRSLRCGQDRTDPRHHPLSSPTVRVGRIFILAFRKFQGPGLARGSLARALKASKSA